MYWSEKLQKCDFSLKTTPFGVNFTNFLNVLLHPSDFVLQPIHNIVSTLQYFHLPTFQLLLQPHQFRLEMGYSKKIYSLTREYFFKFPVYSVILSYSGQHSKIFLKKSCLTMYFSQAKSNRLRWDSNPRPLDSNLEALPLSQVHDKNRDF